MKSPKITTPELQYLLTGQKKNAMSQLKHRNVLMCSSHSVS